MYDETIHKILNRDIIATKIIDTILNIQKNIRNVKEKKGIFIYGKNGIGKSEFVKYCIEQMNLCKIDYNGFDNRNSSMIESLKNNSVSNYNILSVFNKKKTKNVIVMDDVEIMNKGDKGGINSLVKLIRPKKTKKQIHEVQINQPLLCICDEKLDKKLNELKKMCYEVYLPSPSNSQIIEILKYKGIDLDNTNYFTSIEKDKIILFINNTLTKLFDFIDVYTWDSKKYMSIVDENIKNTEKEIIKDITKDIYIQKYSVDKYTSKINETDKTSLSLVLHENIHLFFETFKKIVSTQNTTPTTKTIVHDYTILHEYKKLLEKYSYIDYYDRVIFQKQIWILNDLTSLLKIFYVNNFTQFVYENTPNKAMLQRTIQKSDILFTKVLTKYTSEYNNKLFFNYLNTILYIDNKDILYFFLQLFKEYYSGYIKDTSDNVHIYNNDKVLDKVIEEIVVSQHPILCNVSKLELKRIFKFIDKIYIF